MFHVILYEPEIPPNTGNIMRLCSNTGCSLHLIQPLGFFLNDQRLQRASMDYAEVQDLQIHPNLDTCLSKLNYDQIFALTTKGETIYTAQKFLKNTAFIFGPESRGLPKSILESCDKKLKIPMLEGSRSINLANSAAIVIYEAWRQNNFG